MIVLICCPVIAGNRDSFVHREESSHYIRSRLSRGIPSLIQDLSNKGPKRLCGWLEPAANSIASHAWISAIGIILLSYKLSFLRLASAGGKLFRRLKISPLDPLIFRTINQYIA